MYNKFRSRMGLIISDCDDLRGETASFHSQVNTFTSKYRTRFLSIVKRANSEEQQQNKDENSLKQNIQLHEFLSKQIIDSTQYKLLRPNRKAEKFKIREETMFNRNPVLYLKSQLKQDKQRSQKISLQARNFSIQQQKFVQKLENYKDFIGLK